MISVHPEKNKSIKILCWLSS